MDKVVREFSTGANRDVDTGKLDFEGFLSPLVMEEFARYMHKNRHLRDGTIRDSDNWQKGIPLDVYMKSAWRHFFTWWAQHRAGADVPVTVEHLCALLFNVQGYLHELLKANPVQTIQTGQEWRARLPTLDDVEKQWGLPSNGPPVAIGVAWAEPPEPPATDGSEG